MEPDSDAPQYGPLPQDAARSMTVTDTRDFQVSGFLRPLEPRYANITKVEG